MALVSRQHNLLVAEDWKKIYQTFKDANFQSYDFETIRKSMIDYLKLYYPEDFNDFIESSEFIALIDLISFLGQSLAFRTDLNTRENFLDTAERRDSILKLARLVSYNPKRSIPASGFLKIESVTTSETVVDSNGINLANVIVTWNDSTNDNWLEQFNVILNAALIDAQVIGKSGNSQIINGIDNKEYTLNIVPTTIPVYQFTSSIEGATTLFEVVSATSVNKNYIYEVPPRPTQLFNILYRNDNNGNASNNTGYFLYFKQGSLKTTTFSLAESLPNRVVGINVPSINNNDTWLYSLLTDGTVDQLWTQVPAISGVNVVYNKQSDRNLYQVNTKVNDQVELVFGDGSFSNVPSGNYAFYHRVSNGLTYKITPDEMQGITININYVSRTGRTERLSVRANLHYTVTNAVSRESSDEIRQKAPQQYYTQNRMVTGEDYNIFPYTNFSNIIKVKAVNRTSSGISRYLDVADPTGKYSSTNIFADDGMLYCEDYVKQFTFTFSNTSDITKFVYENVLNLIKSQEMQHFYFANFTRFPAAGAPIDAKWALANTVTNGCTGNFRTSNNSLIQVGHVTSSDAKYIRVGAIIKFRAPEGYYFNAQNTLTEITATRSGNTTLYAAVTQVIGDGTAGGSGVFADGTGPIMVNQVVPTGAIVDQIIPLFKNDLSSDLVSLIISNLLAYKNFGISYNPNSQSWTLIDSANLSLNEFSLTNQGNLSGTNLDSSWMVYFVFNGKNYTVGYRGLNYVFESFENIKFYYDGTVKIFDSKTGSTVHDQIKILKVNSQANSLSPLGVDYVWYIHKNIVEVDGYENNTKMLITFPDTNNDGIPDNPDLFDIIVDPYTNSIDKLVFFKQDATYDSFVDYLPIDKNLINTSYRTKADIELMVSLFTVGQVFYAQQDDKFYIITESGGNTLVVETDIYKYKVGRDGLYFQYIHHSPSYRRIDPSPNNIIDLYVLTKSYETSYRRWVQDSTGKVVEPIVPDSEELRLEFGTLENYKVISDTLIFNSARFKPLFGEKADPLLQATFKVVKNPLVNVSDNDIKSNVISAINSYFSIENWDFGETFYFSELSAYLHTKLTPTISSIVIVPKNTDMVFGSLHQINSQPDEILISAATVDNVEVINSITAAQLNQTLVVNN